MHTRAHVQWCTQFSRDESVEDDEHWIEAEQTVPSTAEEPMITAGEHNSETAMAVCGDRDIDEPGSGYGVQQSVLFDHAVYVF